MSIAALLLSVKNLYCNLQVPGDTAIMFPVLRSFERESRGCCRSDADFFEWPAPGASPGHFYVTVLLAVF